MRVGFGCVWSTPPESTWSGTPWRLRAALARRTDVVDLDVTPPRLAQLAYKLAAIRFEARRPVSVWKHHRTWQAHLEHRLRRAVSAVECDAVLQIGDLARVDAPFVLVQDLCWDAVLDIYDDTARSAIQFPGMRRDDLLRCRDRQLDVYRHAAGVATMSAWLGRTLVERCGVPASKVHVVPPGIDVVPGPGGTRTERGSPRRRLLLVGRDFARKGGDAVLAAVARLHEAFDPTVTLTIAGPSRWPVAGPVPAGVHFLGPVDRTRLSALFRAHDLLVMPSYLEGFGKVFAEALAHGLPCVGRDAYAMPEIITPGGNGALVRTRHVDELAGAIIGVLTDDAVYERCSAQAEAVVARYSWDRAAADVHAVLGAPDEMGTERPEPPVPTW